MSVKKSERIIWIDCEMTGLDVNTQTIVEIACLVTESDLSFLGKGCDFVISQPKKVLDKMDCWCRKTFATNGLTEMIRTSQITMKDAEEQVLSYLRQHTDPGVCCLAGNSVGMDRVFLQKYMPSVEKHLNYRTIDVSSIKEVLRRWNPELYAQKPQKTNKHRAKDDILESIEELKWYKKHVFN